MSAVTCVAAGRIAAKMYAYVKQHKVNPMKNFIGPMSQVHDWFIVHNCRFMIIVTFRIS